MASVHGREVELGSAVENTIKGKDCTATGEKTGEDQVSTEKVESLLGLHQKMDQLLEALCERPAVRHTLSFRGKPRQQAADSTSLQEPARFENPVGGPSSVGSPRDSVQSRSTARTCSPTFRCSEARLRALLASRSWSSWRSTWPRAPPTR